jgi:hypothetical protein
METMRRVGLVALDPPLYERSSFNVVERMEAFIHIYGGRKPGSHRLRPGFPALVDAGEGGIAGLRLWPGEPQRLAGVVGGPATIRRGWFFRNTWSRRR